MRRSQRTSVAAPWLAHQPAVVADALVAAAAMERAAGGTVLVEADGSDVGLLGVVEGEVALKLARDDGSQRLVDVCGAGFWCGRAAHVRPTPDRFAVQARADAWVMRVPTARVVELSRRSGDFVVGFADVVSAHTQALVDLFELAATTDVSVRIARKILASAGGRTDGVMATTQDELAEMTNLARTTVNRMLAELERRGAVSTHYREIVVRDVEALRRAAKLPGLIAAACSREGSTREGPGEPVGSLAARRNTV